MTLFMSYFLAKITILLIEGSFFSNVYVQSSATIESKKEDKVANAIAIDTEEIIKRNFFDPEESVFSTETQTVEEDTPKETDVQSGPINTVAVQTSLKIQLLSTVSVGDGTSHHSSAVIQNGREVDAYTTANKKSFAPNVKIIKILPKRVEFINGNQLEFVLLEEFAKQVALNSPSKPTQSLPAQNTREVVRSTVQNEGIEEVGDVIQIKRSTIDNAMKNIGRLYTQIRLIPYYQGGKPSGFKVLSVQAKTVFDDLKLRKGDVLKAINGKIVDLQMGMNAMKMIQNENEFELELIRGGQSVIQKYQVVN